MDRRQFVASMLAIPSLAIRSATSAEYRRFRDPDTGAVIHQLTSHPSINHACYHLTSSFTPDSKFLVFTSYRSGAPQLYELEFPDGEPRQLTTLDGLHPFSATISGEGREIYFTRQGRIEALSRKDLKLRTLYRLEGAQFGECSLSHDGAWIVTALKYEGENGIALASTLGAPGGILLRFPRTIIHPQFHPTDAGWIEFAGDPAPRMHRVRRDGTALECLYEHGNDEFVVHETFLGESGDIAFTVWPKTLKRMNWTTLEISTIAEFNAWHITPNRAGTLILCDTNHPDIGLQLVDVSSGSRRTLCHPRSSSRGSQWTRSRYALAADFAAAREKTEDTLSWMEMPTDSVYGPQWTHPHPSFSPDEKMAVYTSDVSSHSQVYIAEL